MHRFVLTLMTALPSAVGLVSCREACVGCRQRTEPLDLLEVYCSMCKECVLRRKHILKERLKSSETRYVRDDSRDLSPVFVTRSRRRIDTDKYPPGCPTPPTCGPDDSYEELPLPITTSTSPPTCPPITSCRKKKTTKMPSSSCMPFCVPLCPSNCESNSGGATTKNPNTENGPLKYHYMYVGVPKTILRRNVQ